MSDAQNRDHLCCSSATRGRDRAVSRDSSPLGKTERRFKAKPPPQTWLVISDPGLASWSKLPFYSVVPFSSFFLGWPIYSDRDGVILAQSSSVVHHRHTQIFFPLSSFWQLHVRTFLLWLRYVIISLFIWQTRLWWDGKSKLTSSSFRFVRFLFSWLTAYVGTELMWLRLRQLLSFCLLPT